jgi:rhodanese-related sulfurtransferase
MRRTSARRASWADTPGTARATRSQSERHERPSAEPITALARRTAPRANGCITSRAVTKVQANATVRIGEAVFAWEIRYTACLTARRRGRNTAERTNVSRLFSAVARRLWWVPFGSVPEVTPEELQRRLSGPAPPQLLDVRTAMEWRNGRICGAVHIPINELRRRLVQSAMDPERPVVAICLTAHRSIPAVRLLQRRGFKDAAQLAGGMKAWRRRGLPTSNDA